MTALEIDYVPEQPAYYQAIEDINAEAFGPGRFARAAQAIRDAGPHDRSLSFVALYQEDVIGSVRMTRIKAGDGLGHLLGPLAVRPIWKSKGVGRKLLTLAVDEARRQGYEAVILVGDAPYYGPSGFRHIPNGQLVLPRPVDPARLLACELKDGAVSRLQGRLVYFQAGSEKDYDDVPV